MPWMTIAIISGAGLAVALLMLYAATCANAQMKQDLDAEKTKREEAEAARDEARERLEHVSALHIAARQELSKERRHRTDAEIEAQEQAKITAAVKGERDEFERKWHAAEDKNDAALAALSPPCGVPVGELGANGG